MLRVLPYSFTVDEARHKGLGQLSIMLFGEQGRMMLRPSTSYGEEPQEVLRGTDLNDPQVNITAVLFNLTATPEKENHGAFLDYLVQSSARGIAVLIDESSYLERAASRRIMPPAWRKESPCGNSSACSIKPRPPWSICSIPPCTRSTPVSA